MALDILDKEVNRQAQKSASVFELIKFGKPKVSVADRMLFTERLAMLVETGNPLHTSLEILQSQVTNKHLASILHTIGEDINAGISLSRALAKHKDVFDKTYVNLVDAGENGGFLPEVLEQLYKIDKQSAHMKSMVGQALMYPMFLLIFSIAIVMFILISVFPKFKEMFSSIMDELPVTTIWLMGSSDLLVVHWREVLIGFVLFLIAMSRLSSTPQVKDVLDKIKLRLPLVKDIIIQYYLVQTLRVLSMSLKNGVSILDALNGCLDIVKNQQFRAFLQHTAFLVESGENLTKGFQTSPLIPDLVKQMISTGEQSGKLSFVMLRISQFYEIELEKRIKMASKLAEPIMLLLMGIFVGVLVSSLILPIFQVSRAVH